MTELTVRRRAALDPAVVETDRGRVRGRVEERVRDFQAIPYAAAPVGDLRWRSPRPAPAWTGERDATRPGAICPQPSPTVRGTPSEDCLNLRVTTPHAATPQHPRPVLVLFDAGALTTSSSVGSDVRSMAVEADVVVVQVHERMNVFGFLALPEMDDPAAGAFGVADQQAALAWVQRNIAAFGGDPDAVTLSGLSGGSVATFAHLCSPGSAGLFHRAVMASGPADAQVSGFAPGAPRLNLSRPLAQVQAAGAELAAELGCAGPDALTRLRALPTAAFADHLSSFGAIAHGGDVVPLPPALALRTGRFNHVPVLTGIARDECTFYVNIIFPDGIDDTALRDLLDDATGPVDDVLATYPSSAFDGSPTAAYAAATTDATFVLRARQDQLSLARHVPVFAYQFADRTAPVDDTAFGVTLPPPDQVALPYGAYHGCDHQYLYDSDGYTPPFDAEQTRLAARMRRYWAAFLHDGDPHVGDLPPWPALDADVDVPHVQRLTTDSQGGIGPVDFAAEHHCAFWERRFPPRS